MLIVGASGLTPCRDCAALVARDANDLDAESEVVPRSRLRPPRLPRRRDRPAKPARADAESCNATRRSDNAEGQSGNAARRRGCATRHGASKQNPGCAETEVRRFNGRELPPDAERARRARRPEV